MKLTLAKIKTLPIGKKISDGQGLCLTKTGLNKGRWEFRYMIQKRARIMALNDHTLALPIRASLSLRLMGLFNGMHPIDNRLRESHTLLKQQNGGSNGRPDLFYIIIQYVTHLDRVDSNLSYANYRKEIKGLLSDLYKNLQEALKEP